MSDLDWYELDVITFLREHHSDVRLAEKALRLFRRGELNARCTKLERANFEGADLCRAKLWGARMKGAKFLRDDHDNRANLSCAELVAADLTDADLEGAILKGAVLEGAILKGANLRDADLNCADLTNLDLSLAMGLTNKQLNDAIIDSTTTLPKGLESAKGGCEEKKRQQFCPTVID